MQVTWRTHVCTRHSDTVRVNSPEFDATRLSVSSNMTARVAQLNRLAPFTRALSSFLSCKLHRAFGIVILWRLPLEIFTSSPTRLDVKKCKSLEPDNSNVRETSTFLKVKIINPREYFSLWPIFSFFFFSIKRSSTKFTQRSATGCIPF